MRAYVRVRQLTEDEYGELKRWERSRKMAAGKVKRARVVLLSNQGYTRVEIAQRLEMIEADRQALDGTLQPARYPRLGRVSSQRAPTSL